MSKPVLALDNQWNEAVTDAVVETFATMIGVRPRPRPAAAGELPAGDVSGIMALERDQIEGSLVLSFPKETIFFILGRVYGQDFLDVDASVQDAVGEFTNIIYGGVKLGLKKAGHDFKMALPSVVIGDKHRVLGSAVSGSLTLPFDLGGHPFHVSIQLYGAQVQTAGRKKSA